MELGTVHHVSINVADVEGTAPFYTDVLGMEVLDRPDFGFNGRWLRTSGGAEVHLIEVENWEPPKGQHWAFRVDDINATVAKLREKGVKVRDPKPLPGTSAKQTFFFDPAGNMIELNQPY
jgi:catechol 2,3-dioxygenase-like lactoylglutathione lyase family enzyme